MTIVYLATDHDVSGLQHSSPSQIHFFHDCNTKFWHFSLNTIPSIHQGFCSVFKPLMTINTYQKLSLILSHKVWSLAGLVDTFNQERQKLFVFREAPTRLMKSATRKKRKSSNLTVAHYVLFDRLEENGLNARNHLRK